MDLAAEISSLQASSRLIIFLEYNSLEDPKMPLEELNFITGNRNKLIEVQAILGEIIMLKSQSVELTEIQGSIEEISKDKCRRAAEVVSLSLLVLFCAY